MPVSRIVYEGKAVNEKILRALHKSLQGIIARELSTPANPLTDENVDLIFEEGHRLNKGKPLKILVNGNDFPGRTDNVQERSEKIARSVESLICPLAEERIDPGYVYVTLQAGGLGKFNF
ncbi:MAG: hypothetical protein ACD_15C00186G0003 [uncultured bacterium]|nr:MAG: hypothetical protein ACD_15C00186G0003 [uncultured bacterium]